MKWDRINDWLMRSDQGYTLARVVVRDESMFEVWAPRDPVTGPRMVWRGNDPVQGKREAKLHWDGQRVAA